MYYIVNGKRKNILDLKSRMNIYKNLQSFNITEAIRQRELEIADFEEELKAAKKIYNEEYLKNLEEKFKRWLKEDIEREMLF